MKICIVIPVYNEDRHIGDVVEQVRERALDVVVINDGSTDRSEQIARDKGAVVISHTEKKGKGVSLRDGFAYAVDHGFDGIIAMDGDGQHHVDDLETFIVKARQCPDSVISGNRMMHCPNMPFIRRLVNRLMSGMISFLCRQPIPDTQCGFRYIGSAVLRSINLTSSDFEIETEVLVKASRQGFKVHSIPIRTIYGDELSKINPFVDTLRFLKYMIKELRSSHRAK